MSTSSSWPEPKAERPSWDEYFLRLARLAATRATCPRKAVGAVVVREKRVIGTGFNGSMPGSPHCTDDGCLMEDTHCTRTIHAELNALGEAGREARGATLYCSVLPCWGCTKFAVSRGIVEIVFEEEYRWDPKLGLAENLGVTIRRLGKPYGS